MSTHYTDEFKKEKKRNLRFLIAYGVVIVCLIIISSINLFKVSSAYNEVEVLISEEQYEQAAEMLADFENKDYRDTKALIALCKAHEEYASGEAVRAYYTLKDVNFFFQSEASNAAIASFKDTLAKEFDAHNKSLEETTQKSDENRQISVPYVGMAESKINKTSLGSPSSYVRSNYEIKNGKQYIATLYDFYRNKTCIFTARCVQGTVTEVFDKRYTPKTRYVPQSSTKPANNKPSVDGFSDPEDFYDWYWDDFFDYEDAEDYYYSHRKK